jgi:transposase-like protein
MSRRYTPEEKYAILAQLQANRGNIALTRLQTGVPERTLNAWRREMWLLRQPLHTPQPPQQYQENQPPSNSEGMASVVSLTQKIPDFADNLEAMKFMRERIMRKLLNLTVTFDGDLSLTTPYQRALVLSQLLERMMKLDEHLRPYEPYPEDNLKIRYYEDPTFETEYVDDDKASESDSLPHPSPQESQDFEQS